MKTKTLPLHDLDEPRLKFNRGYHDAAHDFKNSRSRLVVDRGDQDFRHVSFTFNAPYAYGYQEGLRDASDRTYRGWSEDAWCRCSEAHELQTKFLRTFKAQQRKGRT